MDVVITEAALRETGGLFCCMSPHNSDAYRTPSVSKSIKESIRLGRITSTDVLKAIQIIRLGPSLENWNRERILRDIGRNAKDRCDHRPHGKERPKRNAERDAVDLHLSEHSTSQIEWRTRLTMPYRCR